jgi:predicted nucleotidyltransferase
MTTAIQSLRAELRRGMEDIYRVRLKGVYLYGSCARAEQESESDVDVLVVLDEINSYGREIDCTSELVAALSLRYQVSVSRVFATQEDWSSARSAFLSNVRRDAIAA